MQHLHMNKIVNIIFFLIMLCVTPMHAQHKGFNPQKFEADMEQFITCHAGLTPVEASKFFPVFRKEQEKKRALFVAKMRCRKVDFSDEKVCEKSIRELEDLDAQTLNLQRKYHMEYLKILPASKVLKIMKAEDKFHREAIRRATKKH